MPTREAMRVAPMENTATAIAIGSPASAALRTSKSRTDCR
ncbi:Uncharacterised protein [Mycobacteroides abscessus subsp. abscessus]|nr:Uncharacterised protein [Mycobacteroides abscessus subsp. abscessus]